MGDPLTAAAGIVMGAELTLRAVKVLAPLIQDLVRYFGGGPRPNWISRLPSKLQSEIELERLEVRKRSNDES